MKIGIIGSGNVGRVLGTAFIKEGYQVLLGARNTSKEEVIKWKNDNETAQIGSFESAALFGDIIVLATPGHATEEAITIAGINNFDKKVVIDATNPISESKPPINGALQFFTNMNESLMESLQKLVPAAHFVKAFNSVGNALMYKPDFGDNIPTMFICGNDDAAKKTVTNILTAFGWEAADMGKAESAMAIEALCILWCAPGFLHNQWTHAFKLLKK